METEFLEISKNIKLEIQNPKTTELYKQKTNGFNDKNELANFLLNEPSESYSRDLDF